MINHIVLFVKLRFRLDSSFFAHKKGGGSTKNGRDSKSKRLGCKIGDGQHVNAGTIIYRQRGTKIHPGLNVGLGNDHTLYALIPGFVKFQYKTKKTKKVSVFSTRS